MLTVPGYTALRPLQASGYNTLYRAVRVEDSLPVILKTPTPLHPGPRERERYRREHALLQRLQGVGGVLAMHAYALLQERPVLVLEDVGGTALSEYRGQPLEPARVLDLAIGLAAALAEVHQRGIIHKDIKPANILVTSQGEVRLIDFGIATLQQVEHVEAGPAQLVEGTLPYMSPEQTGRMNRGVDYRTDLYSLGVTLYELLTGSLPFEGGNALEWFHAHLARAPEPPHARAAGVPEALSAVVLKLLAKVAEERYQSAEGLQADLERCRQGLRSGRPERFALGAQDVPRRLQVPQQLYGREQEVAQLLESLARVASGGSPELVLVSGYSGIGKSAVIHELQRPVLERRGLLLRGKFDQLQRDIPYATLAQALRGLVQHLLADTDEQQLARWRQRLQQAWGEHGQLLVDLVPQLELVVGRQPPIPPLPLAEAQVLFCRVFQQFLSTFTRSGRPLVLVLDDLQWADLASLQLVQHLVTQRDSQQLLVVGAYRDSEVSPSHPLTRLLQEVRQAGTRVSQLQLGPLSLAHSQRLVAASLPGASAELVAPLAALAQEKTGGNPFFLLRWLRTLNEDGLLVRRASGWHWEEAAVQARGYADNVVDFLVGRLRLLPEQSQRLLRLAACVGNGFAPSTLALLSSAQVGAVEQGLEPALQAGLVARVGPEEYRFVHDRIQQAAYALIPEAERQAKHLRIGRLLLASLSPEQVRVQLFEVVHQLNAGRELLEEPAERLRLAQLNAEAGRKAQASTAHRSAADFFSTALSLLPEDRWESHPALAFSLCLEQARSEFMSGHAAQASQLVEPLLARARTRPQQAAVFQLKSDLHLARGDSEAAATCLLEGLASFGLHLPAHPSWEEVVAASEEVWRLLGERSVESLVENLEQLPRMEDPEQQAVVSLLTSLLTPAYNTDNNLLLLHLCHLVALSLRHGNTESSVHAYGWFGAVVAPALQRYREGYAFGRLALELLERHGYSSQRCKALFVMGYISCWSRPLSSCLAQARSAVEQALLWGDMRVACLGSNDSLLLHLASGCELAEVWQESEAGLDVLSKAGFRDAADCVRYCRGFIQQLRGLTRSFDSMDWDGLQEAEFEASMAVERMSTARFMFWVIKMQSRYLCGAYAQAHEAAQRAAELTWSCINHIILLSYHLFRALTLAACYRAQAPAPEREALLATLGGHHRQLAQWADNCPENFRAPERLVAAELARTAGRVEEAMQAYEEALQAARAQGFLHLVALAQELAARFWHERGLATVALAYAREARLAWRQWGAEGKARHLEEQLSLPAEPQASQESTSTSYDTGSKQVDALAVVKAQQAVSREIVLERLVGTLLQVALESAGAQRGALLLLRGEHLVVEAFADSSLGQSGQVPAAQGQLPLPWSLLTYVRRTREPVILGDASQEHPFSADPFFARSAARSLLALPLLRGEELCGVLSLENDLATEAFSSARLALLEHLASQATISLENARLYGEVQRAEAALRRSNEELERRVQQRTRELERAQARVVEIARAAGMAEVASNVLHNVGNVLTSVMANSELMRRVVGSSRLNRLSQVVTLLEENQAQLATFLTSDPRGCRVLEYLRALAEELSGEQQRLLQQLEELDQRVHHIRAIVQVQQSYAKSSLLEEECDLLELVEDALRIQLDSFLRHGVTVARDFPPLERVRVDKHKVLQILINLISNARFALRAAPEGQKRLLLRVRVEQGRALVQVVDSGMGIDPQVRERLFTHGFTTREDGHGFGLHSSALAAKVLGGSLRLESEGVGLGATATLEFPVSPLPASDSRGGLPAQRTT